jgi:hypothetical protein
MHFKFLNFIIPILKKQYFKVPETPLPSLNILKEDRDNWNQFKENMDIALFEMRIPDKNLIIKPLPTVSNPLLDRRMKKTKTNELNTKNNDIIVEDISRENTFVQSKTPTNSRPPSPSN